MIVHIHCSMSFGIADKVSPCVANTATNKAVFLNQGFCVVYSNFTGRSTTVGGWTNINITFFTQSSPFNNRSFV